MQINKVSLSAYDDKRSGKTMVWAAVPIEIIELNILKTHYNLIFV